MTVNISGHLKERPLTQEFNSKTGPEFTTAAHWWTAVN
jgi:hypothetical protein